MRRLRTGYWRLCLLVTHQDWETYRLRDHLCNNVLRDAEQVKNSRRGGSEAISLRRALSPRAICTGRSVDVLVDLEPGRSLLDLGGLLMELQDLLGCRVDVVTEQGLHRRIRERLLREAVPL